MCIDHEKIEDINDINLAPLKRFIISYRREFSTVIEAENIDNAMTKVQDKPWAYQWECIGDLHHDFFEHDTDDLTEKL